MKKRHLTLLVAIFAIITMLFVSCNSEVAENSVTTDSGKELVYASFTDDSKALGISYDVPAYETLYWRYAAHKNDTYGTSGQTWVKEEIDPTDEEFLPVKQAVGTIAQPGLDGKVGPFSQGKWVFKLEAYRSCTVTVGESVTTYNFEDLVFSGTASDVILNKNQTNYIAITVSPTGESGKIKFNTETGKKPYYVWDSPSSSTANLKLSIDLVGTKTNVTYPYVYTEELTNDNGKYYLKGVKVDEQYTGYLAVTFGDVLTTDIPADVYVATVRVVEPTTETMIDEFALQAISLQVYGGLETIISGDIKEGLSEENYFSVSEQVIASQNSNNDGGAEFVVNKTPSTTTGDTIKTTVTFPDSTLTPSTQHTLTVDVTTIETAETQFVIVKEQTTDPDEVAVAAIGLDLKETIVTKDAEGNVTDIQTNNVDSFGGDYVTITTFIQEGLKVDSNTKITVVYNGDKSQPIANGDGVSAIATLYDTDEAMGNNLGYSNESGKLRFKTDHFSDFYVKTDGLVAQNVSTGKFYSTLQSAMDAAISGQTVKVLNKDINLGTTGLVITGTNVTLDLNGRTISGAVNGKLVTITESASVTITDSSNPSTGRIYNTDKTAQGHDAIYNLGSLVIEAGSFGHEQYTRGPGLRNLGTAIINGGVFYGCGVGGYAYSVINGNENDCPSLTLNAGTISGHTHGGIAVNSGNVTIEKDFVVDIEGDYYGIWVTNDGTATNVVINGGSFSGGKYGIYTALDDGETAGYSDLSIKVYDGSFSGTTGSIKRGNTGTTYTFEVELYGGIYSSDPSDYCAPGYEVVPSSEYAGWWTIKENEGNYPTADINYSTISSLISAPMVTNEVKKYWTNHASDSLSMDTDGYYMISSAADFARYALMMNGGDSTTVINAKLTADIDLSGFIWVPVSFANGVHDGSVFDGQGHTVSNLHVEGTECVGLFGAFPCCTVKNLNVSDAVVVGTHFVSALVGHGLCTAIENCSVNNAYVVCNHVETTEGLDDGDKAGALVGYLSGEPNASVSGSSVTNCIIKACRDFGGIAGMANGTASVTGNSATNVVLFKCPMESSYTTYFGDVGRVAGTVTVSNNILGNIKGAYEIIANAVFRVTLNNSPSSVYYFTQDTLLASYDGLNDTILKHGDYTMELLKDYKFTMPEGATAWFYIMFLGDNITFDLCGHTLRIRPTNTYMFYANGAKNLTLKNGKLVNDAKQDVNYGDGNSKNIIIWHGIDADQLHIVNLDYSTDDILFYYLDYTSYNNY